MKNFLLNTFTKKREAYESEKVRLLKSSIFLLFIFVAFSFAFYLLISNSMNGGDLSSVKKSASEADLLRRQITGYKKEINELKQELQAYKDAFGELDLSAVEENKTN